MTLKPTKTEQKSGGGDRSSAALEDHELDAAVGGADAFASGEQNDEADAFAASGPSTAAAGGIFKPIKKPFQGW